MSRKRVSHDAIIVINQKKREISIFIAITLVVLVVAIVLPIRLMTLSVVRINNEIEAKREIKERLDTKINNFTQLNTQYQEMREEILDLPLIFPSNGDYSLLVANFDEICKANNFRLESVNVGSRKGASRADEPLFEALNTWNASITVIGRRADLIVLLESIEAMPMYPTVTAVGYKNDLNENGLLTFTLSVKMYGVNKSSMYLDI